MSEFDDFAMEHLRDKENRKRLVEDTKPEWAVLKGLTSRFAIDGKEFDGNKFEWAPYTAYHPEFLKLGDVAATFLSREEEGTPRNCRVRFSRRPLEPGRMWIDEKSPLEAIEWSLCAVIDGDSIAWEVAELDQTLSSEALAEKIAVELSKYHLAYKKHYDNWSVA